MSELPKTMKAIQVKAPKEPFVVVEVPLPTVGPRDLLIKVEACGICQGDNVARYGAFPNMSYPVIPGHEAVGTVVSFGDKVPVGKFAIGMKVGVGWQQHQCLECDPCLRGSAVGCERAVLKATGSTRDGGYAQFMAADWTAACKLPDNINAEEIAPVLCAGVTVFNAFKVIVKKAVPGSLVAIQGIGGLGHLAVQYSRRLGFQTVAISSGPAKRQLAHDLGAHIYIDSSATPDVAAELKKLGGASGIIATAPNASAIASLAGGLAINASIVLVAAPHDELRLNVTHILAHRGIEGVVAGTSQDRKEAVNFYINNELKTLVETFSLEEVEKGFSRMMTNEVRFRAVLLPWK